MFALNTALTLVLASVPTTGPVPARLSDARAAAFRAELGRVVSPRACGRLSVRLTAHDDGARTRVQVGGDTLTVARFPVTGPPRIWISSYRTVDCVRLARQLRGRWPGRERWPGAAALLTAPSGGAGDTALRVAIGPVSLKSRIAEEDVQQLGFVAVVRGELFRLACGATEGLVCY